MQEEKKEAIALDDANIAKFSNRLANDALDPSGLFNDLINNVGRTPGSDDFAALCTAISSDYPSLFDRYIEGETGDVERTLREIEWEIWFHIGVAVGRRLR
jgi:hypothetical protein